MWDDFYNDSVISFIEFETQFGEQIQNILKGHLRIYSKDIYQYYCERIYDRYITHNDMWWNLSEQEIINRITLDLIRKI